MTCLVKKGSILKRMDIVVEEHFRGIGILGYNLYSQYPEFIPSGGTFEVKEGEYENSEIGTMGDSEEEDFLNTALLLFLIHEELLSCGKH